MGQGTRRSRGQWAKIVGEHGRSGLSAREFCRGRSIGLASFYQWRRRLRDAESGADAGLEARGSFIDMGRVGTSDAQVGADAGPWVVTLDMGEGFKLTLQRGRG